MCMLTRANVDRLFVLKANNPLAEVQTLSLDTT